MRIYKFNSILKPVLWGGDKLLTFKGMPACGEPIGESWELSGMAGRESVVAEGPDRGLALTELIQRHGAALVGEEVYQLYREHFPLLIKFIDAKCDLSIQVHPDDEYARKNNGCDGKTEMWYIIQADDGAKVLAGFNRPMSPEEYDRRVGDGTILDVIAPKPTKPGDAFFIPAGQIHGIEAGNLLVEIQQTSDITYRVWDYNRRDADGNLRQLHQQQAREALNYNVVDSVVEYGPVETGGVTPVVSCQQFEVGRIDVEGHCEVQLPPAFVVLVCIAGATTVAVEDMDPVTLRQGETALVPAVATAMNLRGNARLLAATVNASEISKSLEKTEATNDE